MGTVAEVRQLLKMPGGAFRVLVEGICRAELKGFKALPHYDQVSVVLHKDEIDPSMEMEALTRSVVHQFEEWVKLSKKIPPEALVSVA